MNRDDWKIYGNFHPACGGKLLIHPVRPWWWLLEIYTIYGICVFGSEYHNYYLWQVIVGLVLGLIALLSSFKTILSDPGIWPKPDFEKAQLNLSLIPRDEYSQLRAPVKVEELPNGVKIVHTYCYRCNNYRPPHCLHCSICNCCIQGWDHHCPVFGGCIGIKNKIWFLIMVLSIPGFWLYLLLVSVYRQFDLNDPQITFNLTLYSACTGFICSCFIPPILSQCKCLDKVHQTPPTASPNQGYERTETSGYISYPRQPQMTDVKIVSSEFNEPLDKGLEMSTEEDIDNQNII